MEHENKPFSVYVKTDETGRIVAVNSDAFLSSLDGWTKIAEGHGDKFHHAQGNYFPLSIMDDNGVYRYKMVDGKPVERTPEEMDADMPMDEDSPSPTLESRVADVENRTGDLEEALNLILTGVTE